MIIFPNCKINLGLNIVRKRDDGFHDLETVFYPVGIQDAFEVIENDRDAESNVQISLSGLQFDDKPGNNLCVKAYELLKKDFPQLPGVKMHLHKTVPLGAGLGGGSADGAFTLKLLNKKFSLGLSDKQLLKYALRLGSDCPFFIINKPCFATGRGELLQEVDLDLRTYKFLIVYPGIHISTVKGFASIIPQIPEKSVQEIVQQPITTWKNELVNDFEAGVFQQHPAINKIKQDLYQAGALYSSMSGSGSAVYGIFQKQQGVLLSFPATYHVTEIAS